MALVPDGTTTPPADDATTYMSNLLDALLDAPNDSQVADMAKVLAVQVNNIRDHHPDRRRHAFNQFIRIYRETREAAGLNPSA